MCKLHNETGKPTQKTVQDTHKQFGHNYPHFQKKCSRKPTFFLPTKITMLKRLKLYFINNNLTDDYFASILRAHNLNPYQDYDKTLHRVAMLQCVVQILSELAAKTNDNSLLTQIRYYQNDIEILKNKGNSHD